MIWPDFLRTQLDRTLTDAPRRYADAASVHNHPFSHIRVAHVGPVALPLQPAQLSTLSAADQLELLPASRFDHQQPPITCLHIAAQHVQLSIEQQSAISNLTREVVSRLDVSPFGVRAKLDKLVVYGNHHAHDAYSARQTHTQAEPDAFANLIVQLPSSYCGAQIRVHHQGQTQHFNMSNSSQRKLHWAIFFSHCECERLPVTSGLCVCLIYKVVRSAPGPLPNFESRCHVSYMLKEAAALWEAMPEKIRPKFLALKLENHYGQDELSFAKLQGVDAKRALQLQSSDKYVMFLVLVEKRDCGVLPKNPGGLYVYMSPSGENAVQNRKSFSPIHRMKEVQESNVEVKKLIKETNRELQHIYLDDPDFWEDHPICDKQHFLNNKGLFEDSKPYAESYDPFPAKSFDAGAKYAVQAFENKDPDARIILDQVIAYGKRVTLNDNDGALRLLELACANTDEKVAICALEFMVRVKSDATFEERFPFCQEDMGCSSAAHAEAFLKAISTFNWEPIRDPMLVAIKVTPSDCFNHCLVLAHSVPTEHRFSQARSDIRKVLAQSVLSKSLSERCIPEAANLVFSFPSLVSQQRKFLRTLKNYSVERMALLLEELNHLVLQDGAECGAAAVFVRLVPVFISKDLVASGDGSKKESRKMFSSYVSMCRSAENRGKLRYSSSSALVFSLLVDSRTLNEDLLRQFVHAALASRRKKLVSILVQLIPNETSTNSNVNELFDSLKSFHRLNRPE